MPRSGNLPNSPTSKTPDKELSSSDSQQELLRAIRDHLEMLLSSEAVTLSVFQMRTILLNERLNSHLNERIPF